jgi:bifunctional DNA-binding transcriptional regulator/antitoxin component of YhaV-PrlF toxin-antitoxin module
MREFVSSVTRKGQVTIPVDVRRQLGVNTPDKNAFVVDDSGQMTLRPARLTVQALRCIVPALPGRETAELEDQIEDAMEEEADRIVAEMQGR